jgi:hypothetical protein
MVTVVTVHSRAFFSFLLLSQIVEIAIYKMIFPVVLCGFENRTPKLRKEHRMRRVF